MVDTAATNPPRRVAGKPNPIDIHVGSRVRLRRTLLGMSQERLADAGGLTFQQIQKYERGTNRIGSSRLFQFSQVLDVPVSFFFDGMPIETGALRSDANAQTTTDQFDQDQFTRRETLELVRAYYRIRDTRIRARVFDLVKAVAAGETNPPEG